jgi:2-succinyl-6-hydroxy-2,4-cyclohexadiene-1-carboxylate synthase
VLTRLNDLDFHVEVDGGGPPLLVLHGFTGSVRSWDAVRPELARCARVVAVDLIGHGRSAKPADPGRYSFEWSVRDLTALLDALDLEAAHVLGYSMGGRVALHLATRRPERVRGLILESASAGIQDAAERRRRAESDAALAGRILAHGVEAFVDEWQRQPLLEPAPHVSAERRAAQRAERLDNQPVGLANSLRGMGAGQQPPLWSSLPRLPMPVALIVGERDARYVEIAARMRAGLPAARLWVVPEAGHTVHLDQPGRFAQLIKTVLDNKLTHPAARC